MEAMALLYRFRILISNGLTQPRSQSCPLRKVRARCRQTLFDDRRANKTVATSMPATISIHDGAGSQTPDFSGKATRQPSTCLRLSILELSSQPGFPAQNPGVEKF